MIFIYKIRNPLGEVYIGQTHDFVTRIYKYKRLNCKTQRKLYASLIQHGYNNHEFKIICICNKKDSDRVERDLIMLYNSCFIGLNISKGGHGFTSTHSQETKDRISKTKKGKKLSEEHRAKLSDILRKMPKRRGWHHTEENKKYLSDIGKGRKREPLTDEIKNKISVSKIGSIPWNKGKKLSQTHRENVLRHNETKRKPIALVDANNNILREFLSLSNAADQLKISKGNISNVLTGRANQTNGYIFRYIK